MKAFNSLTKAEFEKMQREYIKQAMETAQHAIPEPEPESVQVDNITEINIGSVVTGDITRTEISAGDVTREETSVGNIEIPVETGDITRTEISAGDVTREETSVGDIEIPTETGDITRTEISTGDVTREETSVGDIEIPTETGDITHSEISEQPTAEASAEISREITDKPIFETIVVDSGDSGKEKLRQLLGEQSPPDFGGLIARHNQNVDGKNG